MYHHDRSTQQSISGLGEQIKLYHYTTFSGALGILESRTMWASCIHFLNDKEEFRHGITLPSGIAASLMHMQGPNGKRLLQQIVQMLPGLEGRFLCVASFAQNGNLLSQWRGYSALGGVSLGFQKSALEAAATEQGFSLRECIYKNGDKIKIITDYLNGFLLDVENHKYDSDGTIWRLADGWILGFLYYASCFKDESFAEEKEWRLVSNIIPENHDRVAVRSGPGLPIPYFKLPVQKDVVNGLFDVGLV